MPTHNYSLYTTFFDGTRDGITLKVYSHTVKAWMKKWVNSAYRYQIKKPQAERETL